MKISRRALAGMALAGVASAQTPAAPPQSAADELNLAKQRVLTNSAALRKQELSMATEPATQFKA